MKYYIQPDPTGKPAIYSERGIVCVFEAGHQGTREKDADIVCRTMNTEQELADTLRRLVAIVEKCELTLSEDREPVDGKFLTLIQDARAALNKATGAAQ